ncbi:MAG: TrkA family potassium uptake protein [Armatimonadetes bacterium]|nr:TrkA family potassium uptake protein [Armatimonadota bacterium]
MLQFAVIGLGRFGSSVARTLSRMGYEVLAADTDADKVNDITDEVTYAVQVDAMEEEALKSLGLRNFDVVVVAIGQEIKASILVTVMLKEMGVRKIVAKANDELHGKVLQKVGADVVVFPERDMGVRVAHALVSRNIIDQIHLSPDYSIVEVVVPARFIGKSLGESALRQKYGVTVLAVRRGEDIIISPGAGQVLKEGDVLVAIGRDDRLKQLGE